MQGQDREETQMELIIMIGIILFTNPSIILQ